MPLKKTAEPPVKKVVFLTGPTGAGKTEISIKLAKAVAGEIICCDSMQIYKDMDILTAKPTRRQMSLAPHHLFGEKSPASEFSAAEYRKLALKKIRQIHERNKIPIFVGGTGLYAQAVLDGLFSSPSKNLRLRERLYKKAGASGGQWLYDRLKKIDPVAAGAIHPNDVRRIIRAIEVYETTGMSISQQKSSSTEGGIAGLYPVHMFCLFYKDRNVLYQKINQRVQQMFAKGIVREAKGLLRRNLSITAAQALGIKQLKGFIEGRCSLTEAAELLKRDTRRYAKRQLSWFKRDKRAVWIALDDFKNTNLAAKALINAIKTS